MGGRVRVKTTGVEPHPLYELHQALEEEREKYLKLIEAAKRRLEEAEAKLEGLKRELILKHGPGRFRTKSVRNKVGKKYRYLVWVSLLDGREHYLPREALKYWDAVRELKGLVKFFEKEARRLAYQMKPLEYYEDICIDLDRQIYIKCSTGEPI